VKFCYLRKAPTTRTPLSFKPLSLREANGKMRVCGDAGLQFRVSRVRVRDKIRVSARDRVGVRVSDGVRVSMHILLFVTLAARKIPHPRTPAFYP